MRSRGRGWTRSGSARVVATAAVVLALTACLPQGFPGQRQPSADPSAPVQDPVTERWYTPSDLVDGTEMIHEQFPDLEVQSGKSIAGRFTDPHDRMPIPAQDDYWRQSVIVVGTETVTELVAAAQAAAASDAGGGEAEAEPLTGEGTHPMNSPAGTRADDEVIRGVLVAPLEEEAGECGSDWILLGESFTADPGDTIRPVTSDGLVITMSAVCEGGDRIVVDAREF